MAFPTSPADGSITTVNGITYVYTASTTSWTRQQAGQNLGVFNVVVDTYTADGVTITYTTSVTPTSSDVIFINIGGVLQQESAYTINGNQITFTGVPIAGTIIEIRTFNATKVGVVTGVTYNVFNGDGSTVNYTLSTSPTNVNYAMVYINGIGQPKSTYTVSSNILTLDYAPPLITPAISAITYVGQTITVTTTSSHGAVTNGNVTISGVTSSGTGAPNGTYQITNVLNPTQFTYTYVATPTGTLSASAATVTLYPVIEATVFGPAVATGYAAGSNSQIQFNDSGIISAVANLTYNKYSNTFYSDNITAQSANIANLTITGKISGNLSSTTGTTSLGNLIVSSNASVNNITVTNTITSSSIAITNSANLGALSSLKITGGSSGYVLTTDGTGNLTWNVGPTPVAAGGNTQIQFNDSTSLNASASFTFNKSTNVVTATAFAGDGGNLSNIQGANITGYVPIASTVLSVPGGNIVGTVGLSGYVTGSAQPNITSVGTLVSANVTGNLTTGNLSVSAITSLGAVGNVKITGGTSGQALITDGTGNLSFGSVASGGGGGGGASASLAIGYSLIFGG